MFVLEGFLLYCCSFGTFCYICSMFLSYFFPFLVNKFALYFEHQIESVRQEIELPKQLQKYMLEEVIIEEIIGVG